MALHFKLVMKQTAVIPFAREENPQMSQYGTLPEPVSVLAFTSARSKTTLGSKECKNCNGFCTRHLMRLEAILTTDSSDLPAGHTYLPSTVIKKSFEKAQRENRDLSSEEVEGLAKQTLLRSEDVEMWVTHLDAVRKRRKAGARKAAATRKQRSGQQKSQVGFRKT